jgi:hypothetical protein
MIQLTRFLFTYVSHLLYFSYTYITFHLTVYQATKTSAGQSRIGFGSRMGKAVSLLCRTQTGLVSIRQLPQFFPLE